MSRSSPERGFTFIELLVALAILGASFTVLLAAHTAAARREAEARRLFVALNLAREELTRTELEALPVFGKDSGDFGPSFPGYRWEKETGEVPDLPLADLKQVTIRVLWTEGQQTRSTQVVFYHLRKNQ